MRVTPSPVVEMRHLDKIAPLSRIVSDQHMRKQFRKQSENNEHLSRGKRRATSLRQARGEIMAAETFIS